jgi:hypothetical protein
MHYNLRFDVDQNTEKKYVKNTLSKWVRPTCRAIVLSAELKQNSSKRLAPGSAKMREKYFGYFCGADPVFLPVF